jgi:hypothetical protein
VGEMGFLDGLMGNASEIDNKDVKKEFGEVLATNEEIEKSYKMIRDLFIFTNRRLILVDKQGMTGKKVEIQSLPYKSITRFSIETAGSFDMDAELQIWVAGDPAPIKKQFNKGLNIYEVQRVLADYVLT